MADSGISKGIKLINNMIGLFNIIILLGSIQGFIISCLLFFSMKNRPSNRILSVLIFIISLASMKIYLNNQDWFERNLALQRVTAFVPFFLIMAIGPLIYFYVRSFLDPSFKLTNINKIHFFPVVLDIIPQLAAFFYIVGLVGGFLKQTDQPSLGRFIDMYNVYSDIPRWISFSVYLLLSARCVSPFRAIIIESKSFHLKWLIQFIRAFLIFQVLWLLYLIPYCIPAYTDKLLNAVDWYPIYVPIALLIYWLGIKGYLISQKDQIPGRNGGRLAATMPAEKIAQHISTLRKAMEDQQLYLNPNLNLFMVSQKTGIPAKIISSVLNQSLGKSYNEFVNEYRVAEIRKRLLKPESKELTIAGLAYECGFNSQPTFQRAFKSIIGQTPKEFLLMNS
jgi:AraC-like DNA-binding protein